MTRQFGTSHAHWLVLAGLLAGLSMSPAFAAEPRARAEWITLGTGGGPVTQLKRAQPANALVVGDAVYLFDVGPGTLRQLKAAGIDLGQIEAIFLSHHHIDHVGGLGSLLVNRWIVKSPGKVQVIGPAGTAKMTEALLAAMVPVEQAPLALGTNSGPALAETIGADDLPPGLSQPREIYRDANIRVMAALNDHYHEVDGSPWRGTSRSYGFRVETAAGSAVYSGDTGPSAGLTELARGADLLVSEVIDRKAAEVAIRRLPHLTREQVDGLLRHMDLNHISGSEAAAMARQAGVGRLIFTHLVPGRDEEVSDAGYLAGTAEFAGPVTVARDLQRFSLSSSNTGKP